LGGPQCGINDLEAGRVSGGKRRRFVLKHLQVPAA
jgi:hypothetical protein